MEILSIGGGPAGLYFAILMKKAYPGARITVYERNRPDDTYGWGVVFSDETLSQFEEADFKSFADITASFKYWRDIETWYRGTCTVSRGHGFAALSRKKLLEILHQRCRELDVDLEFEYDVGDLAELPRADLVLGADGVNSLVRQRYEKHFRPSIDLRKCRFCWLGTTVPLEAFTFVFEENEHGLFQVHAYPFEDGLSTWIVECREEVWRRAGLDRASEDDTVAFCEELFRESLGGHPLLTNRSLWRQFHRSLRHLAPRQRGASRRCGPHRPLLDRLGHQAGDGGFAIALVAAFTDNGTTDVPRVSSRPMKRRRWVDVLKLQKAAQTSLEWFENSARYLGQPPVQFTFNLMTRSKRITYDNLRRARSRSWSGRGRPLVP